MSWLEKLYQELEEEGFWRWYDQYGFDYSVKLMKWMMIGAVAVIFWLLLFDWWVCAP